MIVTALVLIAIGGVDLIRQFVGSGAVVATAPPSRGSHGAPKRGGGGGRRARRIVLAVAAILMLLLGIAAGAWPAGILAVACAGAWSWLFPTDGTARAGIWQAVALAVLSAVFVALLGERVGAGLFGQAWSIASPWGALSLDAVLLVIGAVLFLLESANLVVRAALAHEAPMSAAAAAREAVPAPERGAAPGPDAAASTPPAAAESATQAPSDAPAPLKGGRLIGPLERVVMFGLVLAGTYTLLAAVLAAKGIVRFPEISRDRDAGNRAEYFLVGSLVSWVIALAAAFLVWWAFASAA
ncbi:MAG TPA: hypothetical protein PK801_14330 [Aggregatilineales bacterium]|jgi:hypothetical protein|nr:hypothetical protein [Microbacteriaceae bacterium]HQA69499.1 hypothetical protein [Aggregatilineales bacterium]HQC93226.1 hypothetical protein [Microbacteriaceae bacterium]